MNAPEHGLLATTRYVPRLRLERSEVFALRRWMAPGLKGLAKGHRAIAHWDEDAVTRLLRRQRRRRLRGPDSTRDRTRAAPRPRGGHDQSAGALGEQLHGRAGERQLRPFDRGLTPNLGGHPHQSVCAVAIVGRDRA